MDEQLSALIDDELEATACERALARLANEPELRSVWSRQHLLRAVLAAEDRCLPDAGFVDRVMAAIQTESATAEAPTVIPMRRPRLRRWAAGGLAMAATVFGVMLVLSVMPVEKPGAEVTVAAATATASPTTQNVNGDPEFQREMEKYLLEHQRLAARHGLAAPHGYMRVATPGFTHVSYSGE